MVVLGAYCNKSVSYFSRHMEVIMQMRIMLMRLVMLMRLRPFVPEEIEGPFAPEVDGELEGTLLGGGLCEKPHLSISEDVAPMNLKFCSI